MRDVQNGGSLLNPPLAAVARGSPCAWPPDCPGADRAAFATLHAATLTGTPISSASISSKARFSPSLVPQDRCRSLPSTTTRVPRWMLSLVTRGGQEI